MSLPTSKTSHERKTSLPTSKTSKTCTSKTSHERKPYFHKGPKTGQNRDRSVPFQKGYPT